MGASDLFNVLFVLLFVAYVVYSIRASRKRKAKFAACAERLGIQGFKHTAGSMSGTVRGLALDVKFVSGSKNTPAHTTIDVACSPCPVLLHLRLQTDAEVQSVKKGEAIDLTIGDPQLDAAWIIEGAPPERVLRILEDPSLRARLVAFSQSDTPSIQIDDGKVHLYLRGTEVGAEAIATERIELALGLAEAVIADAATPLPAREIDVAAFTYRTAPRVDPEIAAAAQVAELKLLRATRALADLRLAAIASHCFVPVMLLCLQLTGNVQGFTAAPFLFVQAVFSAAILASYRREVRRAPKARLHPNVVWWMAGGWVATGLLTLRLFLVG